MQIYKITNLINGKIYIGKDSYDFPNYYGSGKLIQKAIKKYGKENFKKEILDTCYSQDELNEKEIYWIKELKSRSEFNNYNLTDGGDGTLGFKLYDYVIDGFIDRFGKKVYQYDMDGKFIKGYRSIKEAARENRLDSGAISLCIKKIKPVIHDYIFREEKLDLIPEKELFEIKNLLNNNKRLNAKRSVYRTIYQYNINGVFIKKYNKLVLASKENKINQNSIVGCCKGRRRTAGNYIWSYKKLNRVELIDTLNIIENPKRTNKRVLQYTMNGELVSEYFSAALAAEKTGFSYSSIIYCAAGKNKLGVACGYKWKYKD